MSFVILYSVPWWLFDLLLYDWLDEWPNLVLHITLLMLVQAILAYAVFQKLLGYEVSLWVSLKQSIRRVITLIFIAAIFVGLLIGFIFTIGLISASFHVLFSVLIFTAVFFLSAVVVTIPACVLEKLGPIKSMRRSAILTKGYRVRIFFMYLAVFIVAIMLSILFSQNAFTRLVGLPVAEFIMFLIEISFSSVIGIISAVVYHDLRVIKEGASYKNVAVVFE